MEKKKTFIMYSDYLSLIEPLNQEQRGELLTVILQYASGLELPEMDPYVAFTFNYIRARIDEDSAKYQKTVEARREAGRLGGLAKQANASKSKQELANLANASKPSKSKQELANLANVANLADNDSVYDNDYVIDNDYIGVINNSTKGTRFVPPTPDQVRAYAAEKGYDIDADRFVDFYTSKGWMVGKNKMRDWRAAVRNWAKSQRQELTAKGSQRQEVTTKGNKFNNFSQRTYDYENLEKQLLEAGKGGN